MTLTNLFLNFRKKYLHLQSFSEKLIALIVLVNYGFVIFDLTYISLRDFWLQGRVQLYLKIGAFEKEIPKEPIIVLPFRLTKYYDWVKGIEPNRETENYLKTVNKLNFFINKTGDLVQDQKISYLLFYLRKQSIEMIEQNPFLVADKIGTLERIKNKIRKHVFGSKNISSKESFKLFWSQENWQKNRLKNELIFFNNQIRPLLETNYFRPVGENGEPINNFGLIDFPFSLIFFIELMARSWYISRRHTGINWFDAMLWRWYDILLLIPIFRWLRIIPLIIRLDKSNLINVKAIKKQTSQGFVSGIAQEITEIVIINVINQVQFYVQKGTIRNILKKTNTNLYINAEDTNEIGEIIKIIGYLLVEKVIPEIRPEAEVFIEYNLKKALIEISAYSNLVNLPGFEFMKDQLTQKLASQLYQGLSKGLKQVLIQDPSFNKFFEKLVDKLTHTMIIELQDQQSIEQIEIFLYDLLEKFKINYVRRLSTEDFEQILERTRTLRQEAKITSS
ncbi:hypothetical protein RGRSB_0337 [cyanobacterium endosymbiont of Rhopalodia gibberula]|uniref:hypothetical protein n=1 Tax=cyanobacterium endosymbiont of Rhopalodia gibberula TaxID=1763363 RepID=UPI000DC716F5|nr:hypothetical protein [cyanobacterium endosymbiont of Rhopalodia gibberula]BBA78932.1 hypothetical protein RGRSB_0337 [cyanobacterium endosymbiont of Rhopalodia gibberula]